MLLFFFNLLFILVCKILNMFGNFIKIDYFFALMNLSVCLPLLFLTNTLFTFLFILEFTSIIIFYKLALNFINYH